MAADASTAGQTVLPFSPLASILTFVLGLALIGGGFWAFKKGRMFLAMVLVAFGAATVGGPYFKTA